MQETIIKIINCFVYLVSIVYVNIQDVKTFIQSIFDIGVNAIKEYKLGTSGLAVCMTFET